jgi:hypothetical protein
MVNSADYLEIITRPGRYVLVEKAASDDRLKDDVIMIKDADGSDGVEMPSAMFDPCLPRPMNGSRSSSFQG